MAHDVFISYPHQDKAVADAVCATLEGAGIRCWIAPRDIAPGGDWASSIVEAIEGCDAVVLIFSEHANHSKQVHREVQRAFEGDKPVLPFRIENVFPDKALSFYMTSVHWLDALTPPIAEHLERLTTSVRAFVRPSAESSTLRATPRKSTSSSEQSEVSKKGPVKISKSSVLAAIVGIVILVPIALWLTAEAIIWNANRSDRVPISHPVASNTPAKPNAGAPVLAAPPPVASTPAVPISPQPKAALLHKPGDTFNDCTQCPTMIVVPAGTFVMGSPAGEPKRGGDEAPQHTVTIGKPFAVGKFAVTFDEWDVCVAENACPPKSDEGWGRGKRPVILINFYDANQYIAWLSKKTGKTYRLPSESEREYIARAGTTSTFWFGNTVSLDEANYGGIDSYSTSSSGFRKQTVPVDAFQPNPWGLYQVHGNVREWTSDCYNKSYAGAPSDGSAWLVGDCEHHVLRNGSWENYASLLRAAFRGTVGNNSLHSDTIGFRVVRSLDTP